VHYTPPGFENAPPSISIDFDGVLHDDCKGFHDGTCYGEPIPGALEALKLLSQDYDIIIFSAKARKDRPLVHGKTGIQHICEWLERHGVLEYVTDITSDKPRSLLYIDDKAVRFTTWKQTLQLCNNLLAK
jgi:hypothetical protein